jgi:hypothetical protein
MGTVAYGGKKNAPGKETSQLVSEVAAKIVSSSGTIVLVSAPDACRLNINFQSLNASFDIPLKGSTVIESETDDSIVVQNKNMTRKIKDRAPEAFERLSLRFSRPNLKPVLKSFTDAISACNSGAVVASNERR